MKRRDAAKTIFVFTLGAGLLYSCSDPYQAVRDLALDSINPTDQELQLIDQISRATVPLQQIAALSDHTALPFIAMMVNDVYSTTDRDRFISAYQTFDQRVSEIGGLPFTKMKEKEQLDWVTAMNSKAEHIPTDMHHFYMNIKELSLQYLRSTEYIQRKVNYYEMAPGRFRGAVPMASLQNRNQI